MITQEMINEIRKKLPRQIAEDLIKVQPLSNINLHELAKTPLWSSFVNRHFVKV